MALGLVGTTRDGAAHCLLQAKVCVGSEIAKGSKEIGTLRDENGHAALWKDFGVERRVAYFDNVWIAIPVANDGDG